MSTKVSVYIATSLDGFIARSDGALDWLDEANKAVPEGEDCGFQAFMDSVDRLIIGRKTYEKVLSFGQWPYGKTPVVVLSRNSISFPSNLPNTVLVRKMADVEGRSSSLCWSTAKECTSLPVSAMKPVRTSWLIVP